MLKTCAGPDCGEEFEPSSPHSLYCSKLCKHQRNYRRALAKGTRQKPQYVIADHPEDYLKTCTSCGIEVAWVEFSKQGTAKDGLRTHCKNCDSKYNKMRRLDDDFKLRKQHNSLKFKYGISLEEYTAMLQLQNGLCAVCHRPERAIEPRTGAIRNLAVDHDHKAGRVRGLLCSACNLMIGQCGENIATLLSMMEYLERSINV